MAPVSELTRRLKKIQIQGPKSTTALKPLRSSDHLAMMLNKACDQLQLLEGRQIDLQRRRDRALVAGQHRFSVSLMIQIRTITEIRRCYYNAADKIAETLRAQINDVD